MRKLRLITVGALAATALITGAAQALADTYSSITIDRTNSGTNWVPQDGNCYVQLDTAWDDTQGYWVARAQFHSGGDYCNGWLERSTDGGNTWSRVSNGYVVTSGWAKTGWHWDGNGGNVQERGVICRQSQNAIVYTPAW